MREKPTAAPVPAAGDSRGTGADIRGRIRTGIRTGIIPLLTGAVLLGACSASGPPDYPFTPVPFTEVHFDDAFWADRIETNRTVTIPHVFSRCEDEGRIDNFALAGGLIEGEQQGSYPFDDTDVYKTIEGASYSLMARPDPALSAYLDSVIALIGAAQEPDGYLYTVRTNDARRLRRWFGDERWERLSGSHELYNAGHLYEAASAHYLATGQRNLLDIALKNAALIDSVFGPGRNEEPPGHQVIEMGLVQLYRVTGDERWLRLAKHFLDVRGRPLGGRELWGEYNQDHAPVTEQTEAVGHAVRASYMYAGMADVAALTGDRSYSAAIDRLWENVVGGKIYVTGGIGATGGNEGFGPAYELPNMSAYCETCASIGTIYWNHRMFLLRGKGRYIDVMERTLYNALLSGISLEGDTFFYPNPLASVGQHARTPWFNCACCTGNVTRFIASVPGYAYATRRSSVYVNLFVAGEARITLPQTEVRITQETRYPWEGRVTITVDPDEDRARLWNLFVRIPGWARDEAIPGDLYRFLGSAEDAAEVKVNGRPIRRTVRNGYVRLRRWWRRGDTVTLELPMPVRRVAAHDSLAADRGRVALQRGPLVYTVEWPDVEGGSIRNLQLTDAAELTTDFAPDLLHGVQTIGGRMQAWSRAEDGTLSSEEVPFRAIPYYAWAHRGRGEMAVWLARDEEAVSPRGAATLASQARISTSYGSNPGAVNDLLEPASSGDHDVPFYHFWPHRGTTEWLQYTFGAPAEVSTVEVYFFDDTGRGECRIPAAWRLLYRDGRNWREVRTDEEYSTRIDAWNRVEFEAVRTDAVRLEITAREGWAGGVHEWRIR